MEAELTVVELQEIASVMQTIHRMGEGIAVISVNVDVFDCNGCLLGCIVTAEGEPVLFHPGVTTQEFYENV